MSTAFGAPWELAEVRWSSACTPEGLGAGPESPYKYIYIYLFVFINLYIFK